MLSDKNFDYDRLRNRSTGSHEVPKDYKIVVYPFDKYLITIKLSPNNEFIGIVEIKVNKDFLSYKQKLPPKGFHDVEEFYKEE
ncbi:unnamed protein product [marine sediment metagenome]|uniref:Uncharacterized protein n=1 Tax=marine sediment metagenome TaxID=412755 RepID=X1M5Q0_9ZZZZ